jgi:hypothetical protein
MKKLTLAIIDDRGQLAEDPDGWAVPITDVTQESATEDRQHLAAARGRGSHHLGRVQPMLSRAGKYAVAVAHKHTNEAFGVLLHRVTIGEYFAGKTPNQK